jgi:hypothetical protein
MRFKTICLYIHIYICIYVYMYMYIYMNRRSISWLLYLCEADWDVNINGGGLLSFPQGRKTNPGKTGASGEDHGNLQGIYIYLCVYIYIYIYIMETYKVYIYICIYIHTYILVGWWKTNEGDTMKIDEYDSVQPVYMDVWRKEYVRAGAKGLGLVVGNNSCTYAFSSWSLLYI